MKSYMSTSGCLPELSCEKTEARGMGLPHIKIKVGQEIHGADVPHVSPGRRHGFVGMRDGKPATYNLKYFLYIHIPTYTHIPIL